MANTNFNITVSEIDLLLLNNDLVDVQQWMQEAVDGKINSCWKRFQQEWTNTLMNDPSFTDSIPSNREDFIALVTSLPQYKNRQAREIVG